MKHRPIELSGILMERTFQDTWTLPHLIFHFWGCIKVVVFKTKYATVEELQVSTRRIIASIASDKSFARKCIGEEGGEFVCWV